jgi:hypothetical protein
LEVKIFPKIGNFFLKKIKILTGKIKDSPLNLNRVFTPAFLSLKGKNHPSHLNLGDGKPPSFAVGSNPSPSLNRNSLNPESR